MVSPTPDELRRIREVDEPQDREPPTREPQPTQEEARRRIRRDRDDDRRESPAPVVDQSPEPDEPDEVPEVERRGDTVIVKAPDREIRISERTGAAFEVRDGRVSQIVGPSGGRSRERQGFFESQPGFDPSQLLNLTGFTPEELGLPTAGATVSPGAVGQRIEIDGAPGRLTRGFKGRFFFIPDDPTAPVIEANVTPLGGTVEAEGEQFVVLPDGSERPVSVDELAALTEEERSALLGGRYNEFLALVAARPEPDDFTPEPELTTVNDIAQDVQAASVDLATLQAEFNAAVLAEVEAIPQGVDILTATDEIIRRNLANRNLELPEAQLTEFRGELAVLRAESLPRFDIEPTEQFGREVFDAQGNRLLKLQTGEFVRFDTWEALPESDKALLFAEGTQSFNQVRALRGQIQEQPTGAAPAPPPVLMVLPREREEIEAEAFRLLEQARQTPGTIRDASGELIQALTEFIRGDQQIQQAITQGEIDRLAPQINAVLESRGFTASEADSQRIANELLRSGGPGQTPYEQYGRTLLSFAPVTGTVISAMETAERFPEASNLERARDIGLTTLSAVGDVVFVAQVGAVAIKSTAAGVTRTLIAENTDEATGFIRATVSAGKKPDVVLTTLADSEIDDAVRLVQSVSNDPALSSNVPRFVIRANVTNAESITKLTALDDALRTLPGVQGRIRGELVIDKTIPAGDLNDIARALHAADVNRITIRTVTRPGASDVNINFIARQIKEHDNLRSLAEIKADLAKAFSTDPKDVNRAGNRLADVLQRLGITVDRIADEIKPVTGTIPDSKVSREIVLDPSISGFGGGARNLVTIGGPPGEISPSSALGREFPQLTGGTRTLGGGVRGTTQTGRTPVIFALSPGVLPEIGPAFEPGVTPETGPSPGTTPGTTPTPGSQGAITFQPAPGPTPSTTFTTAPAPVTPSQPAPIAPTITVPTQPAVQPVFPSQPAPAPTTTPTPRPTPSQPEPAVIPQVGTIAGVAPFFATGQRPAPFATPTPATTPSPTPSPAPGPAPSPGLGQPAPPPGQPPTRQTRTRTRLPDIDLDPTLAEGETMEGLPDVAWRQGRIWISVSPNYGADNFRFQQGRPTGARFFRDAQSALEHVQSLGIGLDQRALDKWAQFTHATGFEVLPQGRGNQARPEMFRRDDSGRNRGPGPFDPELIQQIDAGLGYVDDSVDAQNADIDESLGEIDDAVNEDMDAIDAEITRQAGSSTQRSFNVPRVSFGRTRQREVTPTVTRVEF